MTTNTPPDAPAGPFDLALLTRLANDLFLQAPGAPQAAPSAASLPPAGTGVPPGGAPLGGFGATIPPLPPAELPTRTGTPIPPLTSLPPAGIGVPPGGLPLGGLGASPPPLPPLDIPPISAAIPGQPDLTALLAPLFAPEKIAAPAIPSSPALAGEEGAHRASDGKVRVLPPAPFFAPTDEKYLLDIPPLSASIPGDADLASLLAPRVPAAPVTLGPGATPSTTPNFYFLDHGAPPALAPTAHPAFDANLIRADFPILSETVNGRPLIWLDNAATTQKPQSVIDRLAHFYKHENSNIHRAAHELAARATDAYEHARETVARFLHAPSPDNIVFVRGATEGINLIAKSWGRQHIRTGDEILITWLEHHANIVPWQQLAAETGAILRVAPVDDRGQVRLDEFEKLLSDRTKIAAFPQVSNALGTITPVHDMVRLARRHGAHVLVDGAQSVSHMAVDVEAMDCDWFVFSGHKLFAPTGIGAVYGRASVWDATPPWQGGGNMIRDVTFDKTEYQDPPNRFEAGTGNIADAVGLGAAIDYLDRIGMANIARHEHDLLVHATRLLSDIPGLRIIGTAAEKAGVISFVLDNVPPDEIGRALNSEGIAVRAGHHCAQPILRRFGLEATVRPSLALYNTHSDVDALAAAVRRIAAR
jgi:cysteine desulfurase/selenocysteine lyase